MWGSLADSGAACLRRRCADLEDREVELEQRLEQASRLLHGRYMAVTWPSNVTFELEQRLEQASRLLHGHYMAVTWPFHDRSSASSRRRNASVT